MVLRRFGCGQYCTRNKFLIVVDLDVVVQFWRRAKFIRYSCSVFNSILGIVFHWENWRKAKGWWYITVNNLVDEMTAKQECRKCRNTKGRVIRPAGNSTFLVE